ncbi:MAG: hypothetical protein J6T59_00715 [Bacteroidales bacterium]|nr:hypothetical protein [Bacteroidales bacterium]MBO7647211.1 hypothetical protein [Bacteroidales bacterium]MBR6334149.1 hypothetical protein [Bacteroidales bacterium]
MRELHCLTDYDTKLLLAFNESLLGNKKFSKFLVENGFPELEALSSAIHSNIQALEWLAANGYPEFAVLSNAIDDEPEAIAWLEKYHCDFLSLFAAACRKDVAACRWFAEHDLKLFIILINNIQNILMYQSWDTSDIHKFRRS